MHTMVQYVIIVQCSSAVQIVKRKFPDLALPGQNETRALTYVILAPNTISTRIIAK